MNMSRAAQGVTVVWIDLEHARLFYFTEEKMEREVFRAHRIEHHTHRIEGDERDDVKMYDDIAQKLMKSERVLILGPGVARTHFFNRIKEKYPLIAKRVVACEASDHPTDHQIAAYALQYFKWPVAL